MIVAQALMLNSRHRRSRGSRIRRRGWCAVAGLPRAVGGGLGGTANGLIDKYNQCYP
ncbi:MULTISPECIES: hypothetical protein [unclassified Bartonella]|uniref:hypothetical protein n=1 Tax=unclassified Bartonella TaxID=2645622 RepID=UPI0035CF9C83